LLDGVDHTWISELSRFNGASAGACTHIPNDTAGLNVELSKADRPDFGLSDQPTLRPALSK
jgi:hypothetical protein